MMRSAATRWTLLQRVGPCCNALDPVATRWTLLQHTLRLIATDRVDGFNGAQDASAWLLAKRDAALVQRSGAYFGLPWCATTAVRGVRLLLPRVSRTA